MTDYVMHWLCSMDFWMTASGPDKTKQFKGQCLCFLEN